MAQVLIVLNHFGFSESALLKFWEELHVNVGTDKGLEFFGEGTSHRVELLRIEGRPFPFRVVETAPVQFNPMVEACCQIGRQAKGSMTHHAMSKPAPRADQPNARTAILSHD